MSFKYVPQAIAHQQPSMNVADVPAWLGDTFVSNDNEKPIACGFFHLKKGKPLVYNYDYEEMKIIVDGEFVISDDNGHTVNAKPGDVLYFPSGSRITFETPSHGVGFFCGQRPGLV